MLVQNLGMYKVFLNAWEGFHINPADFSLSVPFNMYYYTCAIQFQVKHTQTLHRQSWEWWHLKDFLRSARPGHGSPLHKGGECTFPRLRQQVWVHDAPTLELWSCQKEGSISGREANKCKFINPVNSPVHWSMNRFEVMGLMIGIPQPLCDTMQYVVSNHPIPTASIVLVYLTMDFINVFVIVVHHSYHGELQPQLMTEAIQCNKRFIGITKQLNTTLCYQLLTKCKENLLYDLCSGFFQIVYIKNFDQRRPSVFWIFVQVDVQCWWSVSP